MARSSDTRQRLVEAAFELIVSSGFGAVSVDQICERAGVKKGSFYHFFASKVELALVTFEEAWRTQGQPFFERAFRPDVPPLERLSAWATEVHAWQKARFDLTGHVPGCPFCSLGSEIASQDERLRLKAEQLLEHHLIHIERALRDAAREGSIGALAGPEKAREKARALAALVQGSILQAKVRNDPDLLLGLESLLFEFIGARQPGRSRT